MGVLTAHSISIITLLIVCSRWFQYHLQPDPDQYGNLLHANDFGIEVEMSAEISRQRNLRIYELGISYFGRTYAEGKKVNWKDGLMALWYVFRFRFR